MLHIFLGTKAQLIKMAPIMRSLEKRGIEYNFIFSGQHQDTIDQLFTNFKVKHPDFILHRGRDVTSIFKMLIWIAKVLVVSIAYKKRMWKNDIKGLVLNHGDTFSTLLGAFLAKLHGHKCVHIESGLRSFNFFNPFPEEITRLIVFRLSDIYFCPDEWSKNNLAKYQGHKIITNGNTLYDSLFFIRENPVVVDIPKKSYAIVSFHRFENIFDKSQLLNIVKILEKAAEKSYLLIIMHKPTYDRLIKYDLYSRLSDNINIELRPRYDYEKFIGLVMSAEFVITDGGSNQEECFYLGKPCLLLRKTTERQEGIGKNVVVSKFQEENILAFIDNYNSYSFDEVIINPSPSEIIVDYLLNIK